MEKYKVLVTRDITQSCSITVEAASPKDAEQAAITCARKDVTLVWEDDDPLPQSALEPYVTDCEKIAKVGASSSQIQKG